MRLLGVGTIIAVDCATLAAFQFIGQIEIFGMLHRISGVARLQQLFVQWFETLSVERVFGL